MIERRPSLIARCTGAADVVAFVDFAREHGLLVRDVQMFWDDEPGAYSGEVVLRDGKTEARTRTVPITDSLCRGLLVLARDNAPDEPVFGIDYVQMSYPWKRVREAAGLKHIRFKDLRAQTAIYGEEAQIPQTVIMKAMGHSDEAMTRRYQQRAVVMSPAQAEAIEAAMLQGGGEAKTRQSA